MRISRTVRCTAAVVASLGILGAACTNDTESTALGSPVADQNTDLDGSFVVRADEPTGAQAQWSEVWGNDGMLAALVEDLNSELKLPTDITVALETDSESDGEGPYYDPSEQTIHMPVAFADEITSDLEARGMDEDEAEHVAALNSVFVTVHEVAHSLIDVLDLPITAREEDSADALGVVLMTQGDLQESAAQEGDGGEADRAGNDSESDTQKLLSEIPAAAAQVFSVLSVEAEYDESDFWDEHSLGAQRAATIACLTYGSDPEALEGMRSEMDEDRADNCPAEYQQVASGWFRLLFPYMVNPPTGED